jgi:drug/metabolite transporter (DMT)-like permease
VAGRAPGVDARLWAALTAVYVIWGSTYLGMDLTEETFPPFLMLAIRFFAAGAILYAWTARGAAKPSVREWLGHSAAGTLMLCIGTGGVAWGVTQIDTGTAALIVASVPLWLTLVDRFANGVRLAPVAIFGLVVGFAGVGLLVGPGAEGSAVAGVVLVFTSLAWALGSLLTRRLPRRRPLHGAAMQMLGGSVACGLVGLLGGEVGTFETPTLDTLGALLYLTVFGSLVGYTAYVWLLANASVSLVGTYAYVNPVVAVLLGSLFLGERLEWVTLVAGAAVVVAVALIVRARPAAPVREPAVVPARAR